ncbi:hypothetical protein [Novosphingobium sediminicola]|uniref:SMODS and SLOG-associating 2TM effector domain-containing protein n=1 Tax=Novosphingobium sediminicola TaxID=563162 RepID=A0A7W6CCM4_9SPHN|nr:hypothetical protein [Novosphingobium sediminicola]MBB3953372.1 hypothetical protein [Novosphingobium sediminicola]
MGQSARDNLAAQAVVDLIERHDPSFLASRREAFPVFRDLLTAGKKLGGDAVAADGDVNTVLRDLVVRAIPIARADGERCLDRLRDRLRSIARFRYASGALTSATSLGLLGMVLGDTSSWAKIAAAGLTFVGSLMTLAAQYREEYVGGSEALPALRTDLIGCIVELAEIEGELRLITLTGADQNLQDLIKRLNLVVTKIRKVELSAR